MKQQEKETKKQTAGRTAVGGVKIQKFELNVPAIPKKDRMKSTVLNAKLRKAKLWIPGMQFLKSDVRAAILSGGEKFLKRHKEGIQEFLEGVGKNISKGRKVYFENGGVPPTKKASAKEEKSGKEKKSGKEAPTSKKQLSSKPAVKSGKSADKKSVGKKLKVLDDELEF